METMISIDSNSHSGLTTKTNPIILMKSLRFLKNWGLKIKTRKLIGLAGIANRKIQF